MIAAFAFENNVSEKALEKLPLDQNRKKVLSGVGSIEQYINYLKAEEPKYILGLGEYSGKDKDKIRIETVCTNKFRNLPKSKQLPINYFFEPTESFKLAYGIGNSYCNLVSFKIMSLIENHEIDAKYTFLHIPKNLNNIIASKQISQQLLRISPRV